MNEGPHSNPEFFHGLAMLMEELCMIIMFPFVTHFSKDIIQHVMSTGVRMEIFSDYSGVSCSLQDESYRGLVAVLAQIQVHPAEVLLGDKGRTAR